jgi:Cu/Ag efflux pump CusA
MISNLIAWSARNLVLIFFATVLASAAGVYALRTLPLDAIPDLSDVQVIVLTDYPGQAPQVVEDQVTYPLTTSMLTVPKSKVVRGFSFFGVSFVYVIFEDGTDPYWARSRVLEYLNAAASRLPDGVTPALGPDATGVGWVYQYAVIAKELSLAELRSLQDWVVRFAASKAEGVSEVASVGGFVKQYSIVVDPARMRAQGVTLSEIGEAVRTSNMDTGGRTVEISEFEFMVRGRGYLKSVSDIESIALKSSGGVPLRLGDVASVEIVADERRGIAELNGEGEVASGIVLQRVGANALTVIENAKEKLAEIGKSLPEDTEIVPVYDRSKLIHAAIETLKSTLVEESIVVALVTIVFLLHVRSALVAIIMLPVGILMAFAAMKVLGLGSNIMSLGGIAIAIGAMIDAAIVMIENAHKHLERAPPGKPRIEVLIKAAAEVGPALFFSLLIITVSFLPIFTLESQEGRLFGPLAFTKTFAMAAAALLSVTLVPALMVVFVRGRIIPEHKNPLNRLLIGLYRPIIAGVLKAKTFTILLAIAREVQIALPDGGSVPLGEVAKVELTRGATSIRTENGQLAVYIFVDIAGRDLGGYVSEAQQAVAAEVKLPPGYSVAWSGQFEYLQRAEARLKIVVPLTLALIFLLLYVNFRALTETFIVMLSLPFALVGGIWMMWWLGFNTSVAVAVGFIALAGVAAETGVIMLIYLENAWNEAKEQAEHHRRLLTKADLHKAIMVGAVERVRPKMMTVVAIMAGLLPILWSTGAGSEVMQRIAVPMIGGMISSTILTLVVIPAVYGIVKGWRLPERTVAESQPQTMPAELKLAAE